MTMRRTSVRSAALVAGAVAAAAAGAVAVGIALAGPSTAAAPDGVFGQHVRSCAQGTGFDGHHDPGMHRGASAWRAEHHAEHHAEHQAEHAADHPAGAHC